MAEFRIRIIENETGEVMDVAGLYSGIIEGREDAENFYKTFTRFFRKRAIRFVKELGYKFDYTVEVITNDEELEKEFFLKVRKYVAKLRKELTGEEDQLTVSWPLVYHGAIKKGDSIRVVNYNTGEDRTGTATIIEKRIGAVLGVGVEFESGEEFLTWEEIGGAFGVFVSETRFIQAEEKREKSNK